MRTLLVSLAAAGVCSLWAEAPFRNPVIGDPQHVTEAVADPHVLKFNGEYYLYATGDPINAWHSKDLAHWDKIGPVLHSGEASAWNAADVWAPECVYRNGKFYLYYSATRRSADWRVGEMARRAGVAISDSPRGPFVDSGAPLSSGWAIDGHVFRDPDDGREYLFYSYLDEPAWPGAGIVADRLLAPLRLAGKPVRVTRGSEPWEDKDGDPGNGSVRYTNEGPTVLKHDGRYYAMYSGGSWDLPSYALAYAVADRIGDAGVDGPGWRKVVPPILRSTRWVEAPGHNAVVKAPNNVDDICFYHARVVPFSSPGDRIAFAGRLYWHRDRMFMDQPSLAGHAPFDVPLFRDLFDRHDGPLGSAWVAQSGDWSITGEQARQSDSSALAQSLLRTEALSHYVFEANVRVTEGNRAGVIAWSQAGEAVRVWIDASSRSVVLERKDTVLASTPLGPDFRAADWHQLIVTKNSDRFRIDVDGVAALSERIPGLTGRTVPGLATDHASAAFDGVALTAWFEDSFERPSWGWETQAGTWLAERGALHQVAGGGERFSALKGDSAVNYEFIASIEWRDDDSIQGTAGVIAAAAANGDLVTAGFNRDIWPLARFTVQVESGSVVKGSRSVTLPRGFQYDAWHTIRTVKQGSAFSFYLDGQLMLAASFDTGAARPGLFTRGVRAAFDDCAMKWTAGDANLLLDGSFESLAWNDEGQAQPASAWTLSGNARENYCCAYTGLRRIAVRTGEGTASQVVANLEAGHYGLEAFVETTGGAQGMLSVETHSGKKEAVSTGGWHPVRVEFDMAANGKATVTFTGRAHDGIAAADDFYLYRLP